LKKSLRKLIVAEQISLDGVIQSPGGPEEDPSGEFRLGGWMVPYADEAIGQDLQDLFSQPFELLLGRRTYEIFGLFAIIEADLKSFHTRLICAFVGCVHFADHTPSVGST